MFEIVAEPRAESCPDARPESRVDEWVPPMRDRVPARLDEMAPGPVLAAFLSSIDVGTLSGHDRVTVVRAQQRMVSHHQAQLMEAMTSVVDAMAGLGDEPTDAAEAAAAEIRVALRLTRRAADAELSLALEVAERFPEARRRFAAGILDVRRVRVLVDGTLHLNDAEAQRVVAEVLDDAPRLTTGQLRARIRRLCIDVRPDEATVRYESAVGERRVVAEPTLDGTGNLMGFDLPPDRVATAMDHINQIARNLRGSGETRTMDQLRADVLLDLLDGRTCTRGEAGPIAGTDGMPNGRTGREGRNGSRGGSGRRGDTGRVRGIVDIQVDLQTLVGLAERSGEIAGWGSVIAEIARRVAEQQADGEWRFGVIDPTTGRVIDNGLVRRRPTASQRRAVEQRDRYCVFPGCRMPATRSDLDHRIPWAEGGPTTVDHLDPDCRHDHGIRHRFDWTRRPLPGGDHLWTTRLGHAYTTSGRPPP